MRYKLIWLMVLLLQLLGCGTNIDKELVDAAWTGDAKRVTILLQSGANIEATELDGWTPLTASASGGYIEVVRILVLSGANINAVESGGNTPLFWASFHNHSDVVKFLLLHGAIKTIGGKSRDGKQKLPIDAAREKGYYDIVNILSSQ